MAIYCRKCRLKEVVILKVPSWGIAEPIQTQAFKIEMVCNSCNDKYITTETFDSLKDYLLFVEKHKDSD